MKNLNYEKRITSLEKLKKWNKMPTEENPILLEWFLDWIFDEVIIKKDFEKFKDAFNSYVRFTVLCEGMHSDKAVIRCVNNLKYWEKRASKKSSRFFEYLKKIKLINK